MKKTILKLYYVWDWEKEEQWLNDMSKKGWQLVHATIGKFNFESGAPSEYTYRLELLDSNIKSLESTSYLNFLQETGIEMVGKCKNWIYLRCKTAEGGFQPNNKTLYDLTHLLKLQEFTNKVRNNLIVLILLSFCVLLALENHGSTNLIDFLRGFCTGLSLSGSMVSVVMIPFTKNINEKIKKTIKELYTCE